MGIDLQGARFLIACRRRGVSFRKVLTIGHQTLFLTPREIRSVISEFNLQIGAQQLALVDACCRKFAEPFFRFLLGSEEVVSLDASPYEGAALIHDMNRPVPSEWKESYDVVFDGGTLEHVFNFPTAIANCIDMVRPGGHFIAATITNNYCGHGFYQFSPELYFRIFSRQNGARILNVVLAEPDGPFYALVDPADLRRRVGALSHRETNLYVAAQKLESVPLFVDAPQQSDYTLLWQNDELTRLEKAGESKAKAGLKKAVISAEKIIPGLPALFGAIRRYRSGRALVKEASAGLGAWPDLVRLPAFELPAPPNASEPSKLTVQHR